MFCNANNPSAGRFCVACGKPLEVANLDIDRPAEAPPLDTPRQKFPKPTLTVDPDDRTEESGLTREEAWYALKRAEKGGEVHAEGTPLRGPSTFNWKAALMTPLGDPGLVSKLGIAALLACIPIIGWFMVLGYGLRYLRDILDSNDYSLPGWDDYGEMMLYGCYAAALAVPFIIIPAVGGVFFSISATTSAAIQHESADGVKNLAVVHQTASWTMMLTMLACFICALPVPMAMSLFCRKQNWVAAFSISDLLRLLSANPSGYVTLYAVGAVLNMVLSFACGFLAFLPWGGMIVATLQVAVGTSIFIIMQAGFANYFLAYAKPKDRMPA
jgi:hypothetical protein